MLSCIHIKQNKQLLFLSLSHLGSSLLLYNNAPTIRNVDCKEGDKVEVCSKEGFVGWYYETRLFHALRMKNILKLWFFSKGKISLRKIIYFTFSRHKTTVASKCEPTNLSSLLHTSTLSPSL